MTEREAVAATFGASIAFQAAIEVMRQELENDKYSKPAREVITRIITGFENGMQGTVRHVYHRALKTEIHEVTK